MAQIRSTSKLTTILNAQAANGVGDTFQVSEFRHVTGYIATASSADLTVKIQASMEEQKPDFSAAASATNVWDYIFAWNYNTATGVGGTSGDTGFVFTGTDSVEQFEINFNGVNWINFEVSSYVAGNATVKVQGFTNL